jgi:hypothetical protein
MQQNEKIIAGNVVVHCLWSCMGRQAETMTGEALPFFALTIDERASNPMPPKKGCTKLLLC